MPARTIKFLYYLYRGENKAGKAAVFTARRGETVELSEEEAARGDALGAFGTFEPATDESTSVSEDEDAIDVSSASDEELDAFVKKATAAEVVEAADDDPERAQRLLDAENRRKEPRKTAVGPLEDLVSA